MKDLEMSLSNTWARRRYRTSATWKPCLTTHTSNRRTQLKLMQERSSNCRCSRKLDDRLPHRLVFEGYSEARFSARLAAALMTRLPRSWVRSGLGKR